MRHFRFLRSVVTRFMHSAPCFHSQLVVPMTLRSQTTLRYSRASGSSMTKCAHDFATCASRLFASSFRCSAVPALRPSWLRNSSRTSVYRGDDSSSGCRAHIASGSDSSDDRFVPSARFVSPFICDRCALSIHFALACAGGVQTCACRSACGA